MNKEHKMMTWRDIPWMLVVVGISFWLGGRTAAIHAVLLIVYIVISERLYISDRAKVCIVWVCFIMDGAMTYWLRHENVLPVILLALAIVTILYKLGSKGVEQSDFRKACKYAFKFSYWLVICNMLGNVIQWTELLF